MRKVEVVPYKEEWVTMFEEESRKIKGVLGKEVINVYHIGSTAIPNIHAKPVIDLMVEVVDINKVDLYNHEMEQLGYEACGENGIPKRRFFRKGGNNRTHHVHIFEQDNPEIARHIAFRDYMIQHPNEAHKYSQLKLSLAKQFPDNIDQYIEGKDSYIKSIDEKQGHKMESRI